MTKTRARVFSALLFASANAEVSDSETLIPEGADMLS